MAAARDASSGTANDSVASKGDDAGRDARGNVPRGGGASGIASGGDASRREASGPEVARRVAQHRVEVARDAKHRAAVARGYSTRSRRETPSGDNASVGASSTHLAVATRAAYIVHI